jgi:ribosome biogenesis GTPase A
LHKRKEFKRKLKKIEKKNKNLFKVEHEILDEFYDFENLPHDKFTPYIIPNTQEENKNYLPSLITDSDIILELLDARDIIHSRNKQVEELINKEKNKLLIYILTKSDLVSNEYITKITKILENEAKKEKNPVINISSLLRETIQNLFTQLEKNVEDLQKKINDKKTIKIGIIGAPNVGKNSLIQSLELIINADCTEKYIYFNEDKTFCINSVPGVLFDEVKENNFLISKKWKDIKEIKTPKNLIEKLMDVVDKDKLKNIYDLDKVPESLDNFIKLIMDKYEFKEENKSISKILEDIITGKISYEINIDTE